jgi:hypothetical protein
MGRLFCLGFTFCLYCFFSFSSSSFIMTISMSEKLVLSTIIPFVLLHVIYFLSVRSTQPVLQLCKTRSTTTCSTHHYPSLVSRENQSQLIYTPCIAENSFHYDICRQLRDLLLCPETRKEVIFPYQNSVIQVRQALPFFGFPSPAF